MPHLDINGISYHYLDEGSGDETLVFSHGLLFNSEMFREQIDHLKKSYRCIAIDHRGQGKTGIAEDGYDMDSLTQDVLSVLKSLEIEKFHFIGLSMGGFVGMRVAQKADHIQSLILLNTTHEAEPAESARKYAMLNFIARWFGLGVVIGKVMKIVFGPNFQSAPELKEKRDFWRKQLVSNHRIGITRAVKGVIERNPVTGLENISAPTLIIAGEKDIATPPEKSKIMNDRIQSSELVVIEGSGHSAPIEFPEQVNGHIEQFLAKRAKSKMVPDSE